MDIAMTKVSSKGQIVIPSYMRENLAENESLVILKSEYGFILKKASKVIESMKEDLEFARRTDEVLERYEKDPSKFRSMNFDDFMKELKKWEKQSLKQASKKNSKR